jgi:APA family basic amino acid/polyamine antiporter
MLPLKLKKGPEGTFSLKDLFFISLGQVVGTGVVTLVGVAMTQTGPSAWLAYPTAVFIGMILVYPYMMLGATIRLGGGAYSAVSALMGPLASGI